MLFYYSLEEKNTFIVSKKLNFIFKPLKFDLISVTALLRAHNAAAKPAAAL